MRTPRDGSPKKPSSKGRPASGEGQTFATNRKARRDYEILETCETGIQLVGTEIKSIRRHQVTLDDSFARIEDGELFLYNMHVSPYAQGGIWNLEPDRRRKLLAHRREIARLDGLVAQRRLTLVPLKLYQRRGRAKVELGLAKGRRIFEKRERIKQRESDRTIRQQLRHQQRRWRS